MLPADAILQLSVPARSKVDDDQKAGFAAVLKMAPPPEPQIIEKTLAGVLDFNAYHRLSEIRCPVMIVHGDKDILIPSENAALIRAKYRTLNSSSFRTPVIIMRRRIPRELTNESRRGLRADCSRLVTQPA